MTAHVEAVIREHVFPQRQEPARAPAWQTKSPRHPLLVEQALKPSGYHPLVEQALSLPHRDSSRRLLWRTKPVNQPRGFVVSSVFRTFLGKSSFFRKLEIGVCVAWHHKAIKLGRCKIVRRQQRE